MWTLEKPNISDAIADIAKTITASNGQLNKPDGVIMNYIYREYDKNHGSISSDVDDKLCDKQKKSLYSLYDNQIYKGGKLYYIRESIFGLAKVCPMCGFGELHHLDHQMPRSKFKSLSVCRLNLIPTCGVCNNWKKAKDPSKFIHPYYDHAIENVPFFVVDINSDPDTHNLYWSFSINETLIADETLREKLTFQIGAIHLYERLENETNEMLSDMLSGIEELTKEALDETLKSEYRKHSRRRGVNDWHTVFVKSLIDSPHFTIEEAKVYAAKM